MATIKKEVLKKSNNTKNNTKTTAKEVIQKLKFENIKKTFLGGRIIANNKVSFSVKKGEVHAIIGENGAGKSTLMSMLFGLYKPDTGKIFIDGEEREIKNPNVASDLGIGMVHQHFKLFDCLSCLENVIIGQEGDEKIINIEEKKKRFDELTKKYKFNVNAHDQLVDLSIGDKQKIEILKMLWQDKDLIIFDEPTAVLTPDEIDGFLKMVLDFKKQGKTIIIITHKLNEVKQVADEFTVLRKGEVVGNGIVKSTSIEQMAKMMVGKPVELNIKNPSEKAGRPIFRFEDVSYVNEMGIKKLNKVSFTLHEKEIVGLAGVEGNGQSELIKIMVGLRQPSEGKVFMYEEVEYTEELPEGSTATPQSSKEWMEIDVTHMSIKERIERGLSHIPEDRHSYGLVLDYSCAQNTVMQNIKQYTKWGMLNNKAILEYSQGIIKEYDVRGTDDGKAPARGLSGGNQQKLIIGREVTRSHKALIAAQPTRGLDVGTIENIYNLIIRDKQNGAGVLLLSYELNEITSASDRVLVMNKGEFTGELKGKDITHNKIGMLFASGKKQKKGGK